jgi:hypothetical protein
MEQEMAQETAEALERAAQKALAKALEKEQIRLSQPQEAVGRESAVWVQEWLR